MSFPTSRSRLSRRSLRRFNARRARLLLVFSVTFTVTLQPSTAHAQLEAFVQAVRELAEATRQSEPLRSNDVRAAASRMGTALVGWDRNIDALEARVTREIGGTPDQRAYQLHLELGVAYRARGRMADAMREFDAAAALKPSASDLQVLRALTLEAAGRADEAGTAFRAAWALAARDPVKAYYVAERPGAGNASERDRARAFLTDTYRSSGVDGWRPVAAPFVTLDVIADNLSRTPVIGDDATFEGFVLLGARKYGDAVATLKRAGPANGEKSDSPLAHFVRGQNDEAQNRVADARREYQAALAGALAGRSVVHVGIARLAQVEGDLSGAIDAFTRAVRLNPNDPNIRKELASAYAAQGRADDAFCELMAALLIDGRDAQAHAAIGQLYLDTGREAEALTAFTRALELVPDRYEVRYALATAHARLGHGVEAARQLAMFDRLRREALERRRRDIANGVELEEALRKALPGEGGGR